MTPVEKLNPDRTQLFHLLQVLILSENQVRLTGFILNVVDFYVMKVLSTRNVFKQAYVMNKLGALGTGFTTAPVCRAGGEPSTWCPPVRLAELGIVSDLSLRI